MSLDFLNKARVSRDLPQPSADDTEKELRISPYGDQHAIILSSKNFGIADEGSYFVATSGPGTFVAQQGQITAFSDTGPLFVLQNTETPGVAAKRIYLDFLRLILGGTAPATTVSLELAVRVDTISKLPTNSNQYTNPVPQNVNSASTRRSVAIPYAYVAAQAMVTPASSGAVRNVARGHIPTSLGIVGDSYTFNFGVDDRAAYQGLTAARAVAVAKLVDECEPVIIGPGSWATFHLWWLTSTTNAPTWEWQLGWYER